MCEHIPLKKSTDIDSAIAHVMCNVISIQSALNMPAQPLEGDTVDEEGYPLYLSQTDFWAKHAYEHSHGVLQDLRVLGEMIAKLKRENFTLRMRIAELKKEK